MKIKTSELIGPALDLLAARLMGHKEACYSRANTASEERAGVKRFKIWVGRSWTERGREYDIYISPSTDWSQGGPIIEREKIQIIANLLAQPEEWPNYNWQASNPSQQQCVAFNGSTPLIAAMRCYVASKLGDEVDVPEELV